MNTGLAFNKALQIYREEDEIILVTVIEDTEVYDFMKASGLHNSPAYDTLCDSHTKEVCAPLQEKFQFICEDREVHFLSQCFILPFGQKIILLKKPKRFITISSMRLVTLKRIFARSLTKKGSLFALSRIPLTLRKKELSPGLIFFFVISQFC